MRTIIDLPDEQVNALTEWCKSRSISRAEAVRRALAQMLAHQKTTGRDTAFGSWSGKRVDSRKLVESLRDEWDQ